MVVVDSCCRDVEVVSLSSSTVSVPLGPCSIYSECGCGLVELVFLSDLTFVCSCAEAVVN